MYSNFSEFSYGYAVTEEMVNSLGNIASCPYFPSLREEGNTGGGYDVKILDRKGFIIYLQFKLSDKMVKSSCFEVKNGLFSNPPIMRFHLRPPKSKFSNIHQHALLLTLNSINQHVYYIAPRFNEIAELNTFYVNNEILINSAFVRPEDIGTITDDESHCVSFEPNGRTFYFSSKSRKIPSYTIDGLKNEIQLKLETENRSIREILLESIKGIASKINYNVQEYDSLDSYKLIQNFLKISRYNLGCEVVFIHKD